MESGKLEPLASADLDLEARPGRLRPCASDPATVEPYRCASARRFVIENARQIADARASEGRAADAATVGTIEDWRGSAGFLHRLTEQPIVRAGIADGSADRCARRPMVRHQPLKSAETLKASSHVKQAQTRQSVFLQEPLVDILLLQLRNLYGCHLTAIGCEFAVSLRAHRNHVFIGSRGEQNGE